MHVGTITYNRAKRLVRPLLLCVIPAIILEMRHRFWKYEKFITEDMKSQVKLPLLKRLWAWRRGYSSKCIPLYGLNDKNAHLYLPDIHHEAAHPINGMFSTLIDNKLNLRFTLSDFREHLPAYYLLLYRNEIIPLDGHSRVLPREDTKVILDLCREKGKIAMKRLADAFGAGFCVISYDSGIFKWNGTTVSEMDLESKLRGLTDYIVVEYVQQHSYARSFYPMTANTLRIMTARDYNAHETFIIGVMQKIGTSKSKNFTDHVALGGMACAVDIESGEIGPGVSFIEDSQEPVWHERHPDTGTQIKGTLIPGWKEIRSKILKIADTLAVVPYMGWDVIITEDGFKVLEINSLPGINLIQFFKPLLADERTRRFYSMHIPAIRNSR